MMQMLEKGGLPPLADGARQADGNNPGGYYELEAVKQTKRDASWLAHAHGRCVKVISMLLYELPPDRSYRIIFMTRRIEEVLASQAAMLEEMTGRRDSPPGEAGPSGADADMRRHLENHLRKLESWLREQKNMSVLCCSYNALLLSPREHAEQVSAFLGIPLDVEKMVGIVDPVLYRQRAL